MAPTACPSAVLTLPPPSVEETVKKGVLAWLDPLPRFEVGQPGNVLRVFERGQERPLEIGVPHARTSRRASRSTGSASAGSALSIAPIRCG